MKEKQIYYICALSLAAASMFLLEGCKTPRSYASDPVPEINYENNPRYKFRNQITLETETHKPLTKYPPYYHPGK